jgi:hypothetical protein
MKYREIRESHNWPIVLGEIIYSKTHKVENHPLVTYWPLIIYFYTIDGILYVSNRFRIKSKSNRFRKEIAKQTNKIFSSGKKVNVYYNPNKLKASFSLSGIITCPPPLTDILKEYTCDAVYGSGVMVLDEPPSKYNLLERSLLTVFGIGVVIVIHSFIFLFDISFFDTGFTFFEMLFIEFFGALLIFFGLVLFGALLMIWARGGASSSVVYTTSALDPIPGVGKKRKEQLLKCFGSEDSIRDASVDEITSVDGIDQNLAKTIYNHLQIGQPQEYSQGNLWELIYKTTTLDTIPGVGKKRKEQLLRYFGSEDSIRDASVDEITSVDGIDQKLAETIYTHLQSSQS